MKKFLALTLSILSIGFVVSSVEAKTTESSLAAITANSAQIRVQIGGSNRRRNRRVVRTTRVTRNGRRIVSRTYRPNGRTVTKVYRSNGRVVTRRRAIPRVIRRY